IEAMDYIVIINKTDLPQKIDLARIKELAGNHRIVTTSLLHEEGITELEEAIAALFFDGQIEAGDLTYVSNARHIALLHQIQTT
ncbi:tRNA uridine-5-carboxymethylaminomethyl(34) synthesis GTPase MnmE, partial [Lysinibacillus agricola]